MVRFRLQRLALIAGFLLAFHVESHAVPPLTQPAWRELPAEQQGILAPLAGEWDKLEPYRKQKWLGIAQRYKSMTPEAQARVQQRMKDWVKLTPEERKQARAKYLALKNAHPNDKDVVKEKWRKYEELPASEKERLKEKARLKAAQKVLPGGSATGGVATQASPVTGTAKPTTPSAAP